MTNTNTHNTPSGVDNVDWLQAIADHPDLSDEDLLAAYDLCDVRTTLTEERLYWGRYNLETYGFLRVEYVEGGLARYTPMIPDVVVTDAELDAQEAGVL